MDKEAIEPTNKKLKLEEECDKNNSENENPHDLDILEENGVEDLPTKNLHLTTDNTEDEKFTFPPDDDISEMLDEVEFIEPFPSVTDRYFTTYYKLDVQRPKDDICMRIHSNRICMLSLAPSHTLLEENKKITEVNFKVSDKVDRASNKVTGKSKHGAQPLQNNSNLCAISCSDGQTYMIKCCINGKLVEVNEKLIENPDLLRQPPHKGGYIAIILPNLKHLEEVKKSLLSQNQYDSLISERQKKEANGIMVSDDLCLNKVHNTNQL